MQSNLFIVGNTPKVSYALPVKAGGRAFESILQRISTANESFEQATRRLVQLADLAYGQRDYDALTEIVGALQAVPFRPAQRAATYYSAVILKRQGELDRAATMLESLSAPRALLTLGTIEECRGNWTEAARLHLEAMKAAHHLDPFTVAGAAIQLASFQRIEPLVRLAAHTQPFIYPAWFNSIAVELAATGRTDEARQAIAIALASPIAHAYPEFEATAREVAQAERVTVAVSGNNAQIEQGSDAAPPLAFSVSEPPPLPSSPFTDRQIRCALNIRAGPRAPPLS